MLADQGPTLHYDVRVVAGESRAAPAMPG